MTTGLKADGTAMKKYEFCHQFTFDVAVQLYGVMQYLFDSSLWRGTGGIVFQFSLGGSFTMTAVVGPVPVFAGVGATASAKIAGQLGMISKSPSLIEDWNFDYTQTQLSGTITIELEISAGVGFSGPGVCRTAGVGRIFRITWVSRRRTRIAALPHHVVAGGVQVDVVVQLVIFKWSGKLWGIDDPSLYNSWKDNPEGFQAAGTPVMTASIFAFWLDGGRRAAVLASPACSERTGFSLLSRSPRARSSSPRPSCYKTAEFRAESAEFRRRVGCERRAADRGFPPSRLWSSMPMPAM